MRDVLAEMTGYDASLIEDDMHLEEELGIDSIKRVEILSAVQINLGIEVKDLDSLARTKTVRDVVRTRVQVVFPARGNGHVVPPQSVLLRNMTDVGKVFQRSLLHHRRTYPPSRAIDRSVL